MKILAVDDHPLIQEALRQVLRELDRGVELLSASDRDEALRLAAKHRDCHLVLLDLAVPGAEGFGLLCELRAAHPALPIVVLSATFDRETVTSAIDHGAMGFIPKTSSAKALLQALRQVLAGEVYLPTSVIDGAGNGSAARGPARCPEDIGLSPRQTQVLTLLVQGASNKIICRQLKLAEGTVKVHVSAVLKGLNVENRTQAVIAVSRMGLSLGAPLAAKAEA